MANSFEHISISAVKVLARLAAKKAVQAELKDKGVRVTTDSTLRVIIPGRAQGGGGLAPRGGSSLTVRFHTGTVISQTNPSARQSKRLSPFN